MKGLSSYPNVPFTVLQRKGTEGAEVHVANPKSHIYNNNNDQNDLLGLHMIQFPLWYTTTCQQKILTLGIFLEESRMFEGLMSL